jgi:hypothetical protein
MRPFKLFIKRKADQSNERTLFYHEDDYCQVEISPKENLLFVLKESEKINELSEKSSDDSGYTNIYVRSNNRVGLRERRINSIELERIIAATGLDKAAKVTTGYGQTFRKTLKDTVGFGMNYSAIYFDFEDHIVNHIWMTNHFNIEREKLVQCLHQIGQKWDVLLIDWNQKVPIDLSNKSAIENYLAA